MMSLDYSMFFEIRQFIELLEKYDNPLITERGMWTEATEKLKNPF